MKIMVVGVFNANSTNNGIANGFENNDHEVIRYNYRAQAKKLGRARDTEIITICHKERPDLVFFCKCNGVHIDVIHQCKKVSKTFIWYMDPLNGNYNSELKEKILHCTGAGLAKYEVFLLARQLNYNSFFLIEGFDPAWDYPIEIPKQYDVSFIGALYGERSKYRQVPGINFLKGKFNTEHAKAVSSSKINLNFTNQGGPSDRAYKILAAKGFLLSEPYPYMEKYGLTPGQDFVIFNSVEDLKKKINYYLINEEKRNKIAHQGYKTVQQFSRDNLTKQVLQCLKF